MTANFRSFMKQVLLETEHRHQFNTCNQGERSNVSCVELTRHVVVFESSTPLKYFVGCDEFCMSPAVRREAGFIP